MYGWINDCVEKLVLEKFGSEAWAKIKEEAGVTVPDGEWVRHHYYPDSITYNLVAAASAALSVDSAVVLELFGGYFLNFVKNAEYDNLLKIQGNSLKEWLSSVNDLHRHLSVNLPKIRAPEFSCFDDPDNKGQSLVLHYYSQRGGGLAPLVVGVVKEVAVLYFNIKIEMVLKERQDVNQSRFTSWVIQEVETADESKPKGRLTNYSSTSASTSKIISNESKTADDPSETITCPFTGKTYPAPPPSTPSSIPPAPTPITSVNKITDVSIQPHQMMKIFPYHISIDKDFNILQLGEKLNSLFSLPLGSSLSQVFDIVVPAGCPWEWGAIERSLDTAFELHLKPTYTLAAPDAAVPKAFRGSIHIFDPAVDSKVAALSALLLLNPCVSSISGLITAGLSLSDIPLSTMQRDHILIGEHLISETRSAYKLDKLSKSLDNERKLSVALLEQMLPQKVAEDLRSGRTVPPEMFNNVSIFFSDIVGFTSIASSRDPSVVVDLLNTLYTVMDNICASFGLYKVETIGDAYMVVGGLPTADPDHAVKIANFAICVSKAVSSVLSPLDQTPIQLRMGIHTGSVMAGIVGNLMPRYCLFGDTVNTASRMESNGEANRIHVSEAFAEAIRPTDMFILSERGLVSIKGKGELRCFWIDGAAEQNEEANSAAQIKYFENSKLLLSSTSNHRPDYIHQLSIPEHVSYGEHWDI